MKHLVIDARESGTSSGRYLDKLIEYLAKLKPDYKITLLSKAKRSNYLKSIAPNFEVTETPYQEFTFGEQLGFKKQIESLKPDLVHFPMVQQPAFYNASPVVTTMQDLTTVRFRNPAKNPVFFWIKQQIYKWLNRRVAHKSAHIITISQFVKGDLQDFCKIPADKITVTLEAADMMPPGSSPLNAVVGKDYIMYVGRPTPHKNLGHLIEAFRLLQQKHPELHLVLAGKTDYNYKLHQQEVEKKGIKNVIFTDFIPDEQLRWLYENCRAYIFPSLSEGFGLPGLEAMAHGAPVVSSNATSLPEVQGDAAIYFNPLDVNDMAEKIDSVLSDDELRSQLIERGKLQVKKFSWERMAKQTLAVYDDVLSRNEA